jgi:hypothetical protein
MRQPGGTIALEQELERSLERKFAAAIGSD